MATVTAVPWVIMLLVMIKVVLTASCPASTSYGAIMPAHEFGLATPGAVGYFGDDPEFAFVALSGLAFAVYLQLPGAPEKTISMSLVVCSWLF